MVFQNILLSLILFNSRSGIELFSFFLKKFFVKIILCFEFSFIINSRCVTFHSFLVTRCKITRYSLQKLLLAKNHSLLVTKFACYLLQKVTRYSLLKVSRCKKLFVTC